MEFLGLYFFFGLLLFGFITGRLIARAHVKSLERREAAMQDLVVFSDRNLPDRPLEGGTMVMGSVVIGQDYFLAIAAALRNIVGGRVRAYEGLFDRARREAILRMKEEAAARGANAIFNIKFTTMNIASSNSQRNLTGVEIMAYGTAVSFARR